MSNSKGLTCPICESDDLICYIRIDVSRCQNCGHTWQTSLEVIQDYGKLYCTDRYDNKSSQDRMSYLRAGYVVSAISFLLNQEDLSYNICDIGYGMGHFLSAIKKFGFKPYGIDVHKTDFGVSECDYDSNLDFDVVTMFDSLEHLKDPSLVCKLKSRLYIVTLPNTPTRIEDFPEWKHYRPGEHLHYFSKDSLELILNAKKRLLLV